MLYLHISDTGAECHHDRRASQLYNILYNEMSPCLVFLQFYTFLSPPFKVVNCYRFRWLKALPAALFEVLLVLPSRRTAEAMEAAFADVVLAGALRCDNALPPAVLDFEPVEELLIVLEPADAACLPVTLVAIVLFLYNIHYSPQINSLLQSRTITNVIKHKICQVSQKLIYWLKQIQYIDNWLIFINYM